MRRREKRKFLKISKKKKKRNIKGAETDCADLQLGSNFFTRLAENKVKKERNLQQRNINLSLSFLYFFLLCGQISQGRSDSTNF